MMFFEFLSFILGKIVFFTGSVLSKNSFLKPLSQEEEEECIDRLEKGDMEAREKLINHNMRLVAHIVKKYAGAGETDDLISIGSIGLIKAINTYKKDKGTKLATYTARCIENEILMMLRHQKKFSKDIYLSDPVGSDNEGNELTLMDLLYAEEDAVFLEVDKSIERERLITFLRENLTKREYVVICLRFGLKDERNYAQREVAKLLKISRSYVSRIEKKAVEKLKIAVKKERF
ncbi:MAG: RNA polymerase sporulation sigma factor SigK [Clostridia bacterium]|nr:RNA polymerase sporulation sigma factor SigK [Clostridia bacterium]